MIGKDLWPAEPRHRAVILGPYFDTCRTIAASSLNNDSRNPFQTQWMRRLINCDALARDVLLSKSKLN